MKTTVTIEWKRGERETCHYPLMDGKFSFYALTKAGWRVVTEVDGKLRFYAETKAGWEVVTLKAIRPHGGRFLDDAGNKTPSPFSNSPPIETLTLADFKRGLLAVGGPVTPSHLSSVPAARCGRLGAASFFITCVVNHRPGPKLNHIESTLSFLPGNEEDGMKALVRYKVTFRNNAVLYLTNHVVLRELGWDKSGALVPRETCQ